MNNREKISRRVFLKRNGITAMLLAVSPALAAKKDAQPNVLLILTDQQHIDSIAAAGCKWVKTPAMDKLITSGTSFTESFTNNPVCSPARSALLTGRTSSETGVYTNGKVIREDIPNMGQWFLEKSNYETLYAGKWHIPKSYQMTIPGFTVLMNGISGQGNLCDTGVSRACEAYIRNRENDKPFLMVASFMQPHDICEWLRLNTVQPDELRYPEIEDELPELPGNFVFDEREPARVGKTRSTREGTKVKWTAKQWRYYRWSYFRHIEMVDAEIGRVLTAIEDMGYMDNTLIVLNSDHGEGMGHHQWVRKSILYDEGAKVPLIFSLPGRIKANKINRENLVSGLDIMPTVCDYAGIEAPRNMRGMSLRKILEGKSSKGHEFVVSEASNNTGRMVRSQKYKYIAYYNDDVDQLFDIENDPGETKNLATDSKHAKVLSRHKKMLRDWETNLDVASKVPNMDAWWYQA